MSEDKKVRPENKDGKSKDVVEKGQDVRPERPRPPKPPRMGLKPLDDEDTDE